MRDKLKHYFVNWVDGMKISKTHFIDQDNAFKDALQDVATLNLTPHRYGILPPSVAGENSFNVKVSLDNQKALRVVVEACQAITPGGVRIAIPAFSTLVPTDVDCKPSTMFPFSSASEDLDWWIVLIVHPFETQPAGTPDLSENPPRFPVTLPTYTIQVVSAPQYKQFAYYPYALTIGKVFVYGDEINLADYYIPPCYSVNAHPDLVSLLNEFESFLAALERQCTQIIQKIFRQSEQNNIAEPVMFICDRIIIYLGQALTAARWNLLHDSPSALFFSMASLARVIKNIIDLRTGSGKEEVMNYLSEWCDLKQGELESLLSSIASMTYEHNDVNKNISETAVFLRKLSKLFGTLAGLDFIGKAKSIPKPKPIIVGVQQSGNKPGS
jgi:hypothetical protein